MNENEQLPLEESECSPQTEQAEETLLEGVEDTAENTVEEPSQSLPKKRKLKKGDVIFYVVIAVLFVFILCFRTWWTSHYGAVEVVGNSSTPSWLCLQSSISKAVKPLRFSVVSLFS